MFQKDKQYVRFCSYGFIKNLRLFEPFFILFLRDQGITYTQIGLLYAIREIARNILEMPAGVFADTFGRKSSMVFSFSVYLISFVLFYVSTDFWHFIPAILFYATGDAFRTGTHKAMILSYLKSKGWQDQKVNYYGHTRSWSQIGSGISALLAAGFVFITENYRIAFLISTLPYLINLINLATYPKFLNGTRSNTDSIADQIKSTIGDFLKTVRNRELFFAVLGLSTYTGFYKSVKDYIQPMIQSFALSIPLSLGMNNQQKEAILVGIIYFVLFISTSIASRHSGLWLKKQKDAISAMRKTLIIGSTFGILSGFFVLVNLPLIAIFVFAGILIIENLRKPIGISQIANNTNEHVLASALSAESQAESIFAALFAVLIGFLTDAAGLGWALGITASTFLLVSVIFRSKRY